eukprot:Pgem_evm1s17298
MNITPKFEVVCTFIVPPYTDPVVSVSAWMVVDNESFSSRNHIPYTFTSMGNALQTQAVPRVAQPYEANTRGSFGSGGVNELEPM